MANDKVLPSREFGLAFGLTFGRFFLKMEDLHYGYWPDDLPADIQNLPKAQALYTDVLIAAIPDGVRTVLDVGCGAGATARKLLERGYEVDCVSPNIHLTRIAREALGDRVTMHECRFEELETSKKYDLILFSESFLFVRPIEAGVRKALALLRSGGHVLITDVFKMAPDGESPIGGGHHLQEFLNAFSNAPLKLLEEQDLTARIAPTFTVLDRAYRECLQPAYQLLLDRLKGSRPWLTRILMWAFQKKIARAEAKHFSGTRNASAFAKYKSYRLFLFQLTETDPRP